MMTSVSDCKKDAAPSCLLRCQSTFSCVCLTVAPNLHFIAWK